MNIHQQIRDDFKAYQTGFWLTDFANFSAIVFNTLPEINWAGFYLDDGKTLRLGPFCGKPACTEIAYQRGVCGASFMQKKSLIVPDVHEFPGHIACDSASRSELVIPIFQNEKIVGVFDMDSPKLNRFTEEDEVELRNAVQLLVRNLTSPIKF